MSISDKLNEKKLENDPDFQAIKNFKGYLIINWNKNSMRIVRNKPNKTRLSPHDVLMSLNIDIKVPKLKEIEVKGSFIIPAVQVKEAMLNDI